MKRRRTKISTEQKTRLVREYLETDKTLLQVAEPYGIDRSTLGSWVRQYEKTKPAKSPGTKDTGRESDEPGAVAEVELLKRQLRDERLKNLALEALIDAAEEATGREIRKKTGPGQWNS